MAGKVTAQFPELQARSVEVAIAWVKRTAEATVQAQGSRFRPGLELTGEALEGALAGVGVRVNSDAAMALVGATWETYLEHPKLYADVTPAFLKELRSKVKGLGIVTDSDNSMVMPLISRLGVKDLFDVIVVSESVRAYKPSPKIYQATLKATGAVAKRSAFVSDSVVDLQGAAAVGMRTVWIRRRTQRAAEAPPDGSVVIEDLGQLPAVLNLGFAR